MRCPNCGEKDTKVIDSRQNDEGRSVKRRRECEKCGTRFTTFERIENRPLLVVKSNGARQEFNRSKILNGIIRSAEKRPVSLEDMEKVVDQVERKARALGKTEIDSKKLGELVMEGLSTLDEIAYIRFASVYREFKDTSVFLKELEEYVKNLKVKNDGE
ncbi:MAG: transcriptional regulator NrdR [Streptococcaceae bacterium]|jgi:transcriptional repressor NrdR|nr:transcriptional regulator NrdR [Streptococcaceae bacterium]